MKVLIFIIAALFWTNLSVYAGTYTPVLGKMENVLYGFQYDNEPDAQRLDRIENSVYGTTSAGSVAQRLEKLKNDLSADLIGQEITPKEDTFVEDSDKWVDREPVAEADIQYPAVDELEQSVFKQKYPNKEIKARLTALEEKTFGQSYNDDLASRVDRLKAEIKPFSFMGNPIAQSSNTYYDDDDVVALDRDYHLDRYESPNQFDYDAYNARSKNFFTGKKANISTVENSVLKRSFQNDTMENRLARLENAMFGTEFAGDSNQTRLNRISSAYKAQKSSSRYDSNKFTQNMATAIQIGTMLLMVLACIL